MKNKISNYLTLMFVLVCFPYTIIQHFRSGVNINMYSYIGAVIMILSLVMFSYARIKLGSAFQASAKADHLVTDGIYKKIRHPVYLSGSLLLLGFIIMLHQYVLLIIWPGLVILQKFRINKEEKVLQEAFGDQYLNYKKSTWF
jgi:protein-S-isoprenylcysteine O-methyltransferase Ste14